MVIGCRTATTKQWYINQIVLQSHLRCSGEFQNIYIHWPANCGKTFILSFLKNIFNAFCNPATSSFAWMEADEAEIIFLNDFRWSPNVIARADLLQALEVDVVLLPAPKNSYKRDLELLTDTPFLAMSDAVGFNQRWLY